MAFENDTAEDIPTIRDVRTKRAILLRKQNGDLSFVSERLGYFAISSTEQSTPKSS